MGKSDYTVNKAGTEKQLDTSMQKAVYIATKMFLAAKETPEEKGKPKK